MGLYLDSLYSLEFKLDRLLFELYLREFCVIALINLACEAVVEVALESRWVFVSDGGRDATLRQIVPLRFLL